MKITKELRGKVTHYLLGILEDEEKDRFSDISLAAIRETVKLEKGYEIPRIGMERTIRDWFQGLGMNVAFSYCNIATLMRSWGFEVNEDDDDDYYDKCDLYWDILAKVVYDAA